MGTIKKVFALDSPPDPQQSPITIANQRDKNYIPFGSDNLYPQAIAELNRKSTVNRALIKSKTTYFIGEGMKSEDESLNMFIKENNLTSVLKNTAFDKFSFGNGWIELVTNRQKGFLKAFHVDSTTVRFSKSGETVLIHPSWSQWGTYRDLTKEVGLYPNWTDHDGELHTLLQLKEYEPEFNWYGVPDWIAAMKIATIGHKTDKWNLSRLDNGFRVSGVLVVEDDVKNEEDAAELKDKILKNFTGEGKNSRLLTIIKEPGQNQATEFTPIATSDEGDWTQLHEQASKDMIVAHNWRRSLVGFSDNTGFDTDRILNDYNDVLFNVIKPEQSTYFNVLNPILNEFGYNTDTLEFENKPPVSPKRSLLAKGQIEGIGLIQSQFKEGIISEDAAINTLKIAFLLTTEQAKGLLI